MARDVNVACLSGRLTRDPDLRATAGGTSVLAFGLAVGDRRRDPQTGQWEDRTDFVDCTVVGERADSLHRILRKGMQVSLSGRLRYSSWERDGQKRSKLEVSVTDISLPPKGAQGAQEAPQRPPAEDVYGEEIPF